MMVFLVLLTLRSILSSPSSAVVDVVPSDGDGDDGDGDDDVGEGEGDDGNVDEGDEYDVVGGSVIVLA